jgi:type III restriction enzyme
VVYDINQVVYRKRIKKGDDIGAKTGLANFNGISATKINSNTVFLSNATTLKVSSMTYKLDDNEITSMVQATIEKHFKKEEMLFDKGIKALSLFFIPSIKDFRQCQNNPIPKIKKIFEVEYKAKRAEVFKNTKNKKYKEYLKKDFDEQGNLKIHGGYFSGDKVSTKDKNAGFNKDDIGVNIILNEKEKLLSFDTSLRFIFSVWALQEGWDNPNIFTICKLADTTKESSRRQQVGRGLRLAIDRHGIRQTYKKLAEKEHDFYEINTLDMIVSGKEKEFIAMIQQEIQDASFSLVYDEISLDGLKGLGLDDTESALLYTSLLSNNIINKDGKVLSSVSEFLKQNDSKLNFLHSTKTRFSEILKMFIDSRNFIKDGNKKIKKVKIRQRQWQKFKYLWETINKKSRITYKNIQEENILKEVAKQFNNENIESIQGKIYIQKYNAQNDTIENIEETNQEKHIFFKAHKIDKWLSTFIKKEKFSFPFMLKLLNKIDAQKIKNNPKRARERLLDILKRTFHNYLLSSASYEFLETNIYPNELQDQKGEKKLKIKYSQLGKDYTEEQVPKNLLYDTICFDSQIEKEIQQNDLEKIDNQSITVFAKLPKISIPTPYKTYNPDFVYLIETQGDRQLFLVVESKGYKSSRDITEKERKKIEYAEKFFKFLQNQLPGIDIRYKTRFNSQKLSDIL